MALEPATMTPLEGPYNKDEIRMWVSDTRKPAGSTFQVVPLGDLFDELLFGTAEQFEPIVGNILDAEKQYRFRADLTDDLSISVINLANGKMIMGVINPVKKDAKFLINGRPVIIDAIKPTMVIAIQYKDDLDNTGRGLFIASQASDIIEPPKILKQPVSGTYLVGDIAEVISTAIGYKDLIAVKNGETLDGITAAALPAPVEAGKTDIYQFGFIHPKDPSVITWSEPAVVRSGEAMKPKFVSQSQSQSVDAGTEVILNADVVGTPPPLIQWIERVNGADGDVLGTGNQLKLSVLYSKTVVPVATNSYKVDADDKFDPEGIIKDFPVRGSEVVITPIKQEKSAPSVTMDDSTVNSTLNANPSSGEASELFEGTLEVNAQTPAIVTLNNFKLTVGDVNLPANTAGIRYKETLTHYASPWATNAVAFEGSLISAPTNLTFAAENPADKSTGLIQWNKSVDTLNPSTQEYSKNYSGARTWTDIADNKLAIKDDIAAGDFAVREKARPGKPASAALVNAQAFNTSLNSNYTLTKSDTLQNLPGSEIVFLDNTKPLVYEKDYHRIAKIVGNIVPPGFYELDQMIEFGSEVRTQLKLQGQTDALSVDNDVAGISYIIFHGITNGGGVRGTGLVSWGTNNQVHDPDSPMTGLVRDDVITITKAYNGFGNAPLKYKVGDINNFGGRILVGLSPVGHSTQIGSALVGGVWSKDN